MPLNAIQLWSPDTCGDLANPTDRCVIHQAYDDRLPPSLREFVYVTQEEAEAIVDARRKAGEPNINKAPQPAAKICSAHTNLGYTPQLLAQLYNENRRKNITQGLARNVVSALIPSEDEKVAHKQNNSYDWYFDNNRTLHATFVGVTFTTAEKKNLQDACDIQFGPGLVRVI